MKGRPQKRLVIVTLILIVIIAVLVATIHHFKTQSAITAKTINTENQPMLGDPHAKLHFVMFEDLKCHNCKRFNNDIFPELKQRYIDTGKANYTLILLAFIPNSPPAGNAAYCVAAQNSERFFKYVDVIYHHQPDETLDWATKDILTVFAKKVPEIDIASLHQCMANETYFDKLHNNLIMAASLMNNVVATPTLFVNGVEVQTLTMDGINKTVQQVD